MIALLPSAADAQRLAVAGGEPVDELHLTVAYFADADDLPDPALVAAQFAGPVTAEVSGHAVFCGGDQPVSVYLVQADGLSAANKALAPDGGFDAYVPHITAAYGKTPLVVSGPILFDRIRVASRGQSADMPLSADAEGG